jgi:uncharacterized membrane protein
MQTVGEVRSKQLSILLLCFDGQKSASRARGTIDAQLRSRGDDILDVVVGQVDAKHKARVYDPRRVRAGTLIPVLTWGIFGLLTGGGLIGAVASGLLGAVCGGLGAYFVEHVLSRSQLEHIGKGLPAQSSALLCFVDTSDPQSLLAAGEGPTPTAASVVIVRDDMTAESLVGQQEPVHVSDTTTQSAESTLLNMITVRYPDSATAGQIAVRLEVGEKESDAPQVEMVLSADRDGGTHVTDPHHGARYMARSNVVSWGAFGLLFGAIAGGVGGGILGIVNNAIVTGVAWGLFGLVAGVLYGSWAGQAITARRLKGIRRLLRSGTSILLVWAERPLSQETAAVLDQAGSQQFIVGFKPVKSGSTLVVRT